MRKRSDLASINQVYGELTEDLHFTGYSFERGCQRLRKLLIDDSWMQCGGGFSKVDVFLNSLGLDEFAKNAEERREIAKLINRLRPELSNRAIGRALKVAHTTVHRAPSNAKKANHNKGGMVHSAPSGFSGAQAAKVVGRAERVKDQQQSVSERTAKITLDAHALGKFSNILADPPWNDEFGSSNRSTENHYQTMSFEEILALPVGQIAHEQAMLFLWATPPMIELALETAKNWGFEYRTQMVWVKPSIGLGKYVRQRHEILLICRRGDHPAPLSENLSDSVIEAPRSAHSAKPELFHEIIERMYPNAERIELFRRGVARKGWSVWGAEARQEAAE